MSKNLLNRIFTSVVLLTILLIALFANKYLWLILLIIASIICFFEFNNIARKIWKRKKSSIFFANIIIFFYLSFFILSSYQITLKFNIIYVLSICIFSDIGGYFIGRLVGGKKLTKISPNKTISGSIGSFAFSLISILLIVYYDKFYYDLTTNVYVKNIFFILIISFICQAGDLFISYFKRKAKIKDTGTILPGHGGLLDRIDGIIFALPASSILFKIFF